MNVSTVSQSFSGWIESKDPSGHWSVNTKWWNLKPTFFLLNLAQQHWPELLDPPESFLSGGFVWSKALFCFLFVYLVSDGFLFASFVKWNVFAYFVSCLYFLLCVKKGVCLLGVCICFAIAFLVLCVYSPGVTKCVCLLCVCFVIAVLLDTIIRKVFPCFDNNMQCGWPCVCISLFPAFSQALWRKIDQSQACWCFKRPKLTNLSLTRQICNFKTYQRKMRYNSHMLHWWWACLKIKAYEVQMTVTGRG